MDELDKVNECKSIGDFIEITGMKSEQEILDLIKIGYKITMLQRMKEGKKVSTHTPRIHA